MYGRGFIDKAGRNKRGAEAEVGLLTDKVHLSLPGWL